jgi:pimeloyl-ACP methyl ester carboxylesterase
MAGLVHALGYEQAVIVGHDLGAMVAREFLHVQFSIGI